MEASWAWSVNDRSAVRRVLDEQLVHSPLYEINLTLLAKDMIGNPAMFEKKHTVNSVRSEFNRYLHVKRLRLRRRRPVSRAVRPARPVSRRPTTYEKEMKGFPEWVRKQYPEDTRRSYPEPKFTFISAPVTPDPNETIDPKNETNETNEAIDPKNEAIEPKDVMLEADETCNGYPSTVSQELLWLAEIDPRDSKPEEKVEDFTQYTFEDLPEYHFGEDWNFGFSPE
jgi:hypothetical protein